jgi:hypothetical protein
MIERLSLSNWELLPILDCINEGNFSMPLFGEVVIGPKFVNLSQGIMFIYNK